MGASEWLADPSVSFFARVLAAALLGGVGCGLAGVFVVAMRIPFIGVCMSHAALAGAVLGCLAGVSPPACGFALAVASAFAVGPLADRAELDPNISLSILFSLLMGLAFLGISMQIGERRGALLSLIWGNLLLVSGSGLLALAASTLLILAGVAVFHKELLAVLFNRRVAAAVGIHEPVFVYGLYGLIGLVVTVNLDTVGGLVLFSLMVAPAACAYQFTFRLKTLLILSALAGAACAAWGLALSYALDTPCGATVVITASILFAVCLLLSPKRRLRGGESQATGNPVKEHRT
jgi:manganese/iron transport system permease protein